MRQFGALLLLLVSFVGPAMACISPNAEMTTEERACCRMMKNDCGQFMDMPASHDCCKQLPKTLCETAFKTDPVTLHPVTFAILVFSSCELFVTQDAMEGWVHCPQYLPQKAPSSSISVLRL